MSAIRHTCELVGPVLFFAASLLPVPGRAQCHFDQRRVTVADAIAMTEIAPPEPESGAHPDAIGSFSPDRRHFAIVVKGADFENNANVYTLRIFSTREAFHVHEPEATVTMRSTSNIPGISDLRWLLDGRTLLFLGQQPNTAAEIYSFDLGARRLKRLTAHPTSVARYDASDDGRVIVFEAEPPPQDIVDTPATRRSGFVVQGEELSTILLAGYRSSQSMAFNSRQLFVVRAGQEPRSVAAEDGIWPFLTLSVSPDGRHALIGALVRHIPTGWSQYKDPLLHEVIAVRKPPQSISEVQTYLLLDTKTATLTPLLEAPKDWPNDGYLWLDGGRSLVVSHAYLPLSDVAVKEDELRKNQPFVVATRVPSGEFVRIGADNFSASSWNAENDELTLTGHGNDGSDRKIYRRRGDAWEEIPVSAGHTSQPRYTLSVIQDMNDAPTLWLSDSASGSKTRVLDLNPQFRKLCFGNEKEIAWKATDGHEVRGGLYLPPDYSPARRYPLVIQTHAFNPHEFWIDGPWHSAFVAQPLAAKGVVVLQMGYGYDRVVAHTPEEAPRAMAAIDGAIDYLSREGIIDPTRVGIIGFSRTVYHVAYTLTHSRHHFAAATLADGFDGDYFQTIAFPSTEGADAVAVNGGPPYGPGLAKWLEHSPLFSIAAVTSPIRLESYGMDSVLGLWSWYSLLSERGMPVEMIVLPHAPHLLVKPWERMVSQQGNVDWFSFWLNGEEDPAPQKAFEYLRWESLRGLFPNPPDRDRQLQGTASASSPDRR